uniref:HEAT repeat n=1 Tax=Candidatus Kentrum sp. FW TaxID=2126338 RepID=A0A450RXB1_9GAMM|nr:MAG: HEAT repeat [Candidatus Kentron sp. FW]
MNSPSRNTPRTDTPFGGKHPKWPLKWLRSLPDAPGSARTAASRHSDDNPYKGLTPYQEEDSGWFFGRDADRAQLIDKILANPFTLLLAETGVGKSSLLQAAVLPYLKDPEAHNVDVVYWNDWVPSDPARVVKRAILKTLKKQRRMPAGNFESREKMLARDLIGFLQLCAYFFRPPLVLVLDQFEEFFRYQRHSEHFGPFVAELADLIKQRAVPVALVISMREDFALEMNAFRPHLDRRVFDNYYRLEKLNKDNARAAIEDPVEKAGFRYEPPLVQALLLDLSLRERNRLADVAVPEEQERVEAPYLQIVCEQLWEICRDDPGKTLRLDSYRQHGGAEALLESYLTGRLAALSHAQRRLASGTFDHLVTREGTKNAHTVDSLAKALGERKDILKPVLESLHQARILRQQRRANLKTRKEEDWYELYHDLFSDGIGRWNQEFKNHWYELLRRKIKDAVTIKVTGRGILIIAVLYGAFDTVLYFSNQHLSLSPRGGDLEKVELFQGQANRDPLFFDRKFLAETGLVSARIEPHLRFREKGIDVPERLVTEATTNRGMVDGIRAHWANGNPRAALELADTAISPTNPTRAREVIRWLSGIRGREATSVLEKHLACAGEDSSLRPDLIAALMAREAFHIPDIHEGMLRVLETHLGTRNPVTLSNPLGVGSWRRFVDLLAKQLSKAWQDPETRYRTARALALLGDSRAVPALLRLVRDDDPKMRRVATYYLLTKFSNYLSWHPRLLMDPPLPATLEGFFLLSLGLGTELHDTVLPALKRVARETVPAPEALKPIGIPYRKWPEGTGTRTIHPVLAFAGRFPTLAQEPALGESILVSLLGDHLVSLSQDPSWVTRRNAARALGNLTGMGARVVEPLISLLGDSNSDVRKAAARSLSALGGNADTRVIDALIPLLKDSNSSVRSAVADALEKIAEGNEALRRHMVIASVGALAEENFSRRISATPLLGRMGGKDAFEALHKHLDNPRLSADEQFQIAAALWRIGARIHHDDAHVPIFDLIKEGTFIDIERTRGVAPVQELEKHVFLAEESRLDEFLIKDPELMRILLGTLFEDRYSPKAKSRYVNRILSRIGEDEAIRVLLTDILQNISRPDEKREIVRNIIDTLEGRFLLLLWPLLEQGDQKTIEAYIQTLEGRFLPPLWPLLWEQGDQEIIQAYIRQLGAKFQRDMLETLFDHPEPSIRTAAATELAGLGDGRGLALLNEHIATDSDKLDRRWRLIATQNAATELVGKLSEQDDIGLSIHLAGLGMPALIMPLLAHAVANPDSPRNSDIPNAMGALGSFRAVPFLLAGLRDGDDDIRKNSRAALGRMGALQALDELGRQRTAFPRVSSTTVHAMGEIGHPRAADRILALLRTAENIRNSEIDDITTALADTARERHVPGIIGLLDADSGPVRRIAARTLGEMEVGTREAAQALRARVALFLGRDAHGNPNPAAKSLAPEQYGWRFLADTVTALGRLGEPEDEPLVAVILAEEFPGLNNYWANEIRRTAALGLLTWNNEAGLPLIEEQVRSKSTEDRKKIARLLDRVPSQTAIGFLRELAADPVLSVKEVAIRSLGYSLRHSRHRAKQPELSAKVLNDLHELLSDPNARVQSAAAKALGIIRDPASIEHLARTVREREYPLLSRIKALEALGNIPALNGVAAAVFRAQADKAYAGEKGAKEPVLGIRTLNLLGKLQGGESKAEILAWMDGWLGKIEGQYPAWRKERDAEPVNPSSRGTASASGDDCRAEALEDTGFKAAPGPEGFYWGFDLAFNMARIDPAGRGLELLGHELADVRQGAWMGMGMVGNMDLLRRVFDAWRESDEPLFRQAAYRAMDEILVHLEIVGEEADLTALRAFAPAIREIPERDRAGICSRMDWTLARLARENDLEDAAPLAFCPKLL